MTITIAKQQLKKAKAEVERQLKPLNARLKKNNMCIWFNAEQELFFINLYSSNDNCGLSFHLDQRKFEKLMSLSDEALVKAIHDYYE